MIVRTCVTDTSAGRVQWVFWEGKWRQRLAPTGDADLLCNFTIDRQPIDKAIVGSLVKTFYGIRFEPRMSGPRTWKRDIA